jgi:protein-disulfide isomerase
MQQTLLVGTRDHAIGPADALVTLVEYGSYDCSHCRSAAQIVHALQIEFDGQMRRVFRHFPRVTMHSVSALAAEAAEAAASQGKFWQMHESLLARRDTLSEATLLACATTIRLNLPQFLNDLEGNVHRERVLRDFHCGLESGVVSTPTFFINGLRHDDVADRDVLRAAIMVSSLLKAGEHEKVRSKFAPQTNGKQPQDRMTSPFEEPAHAEI